MQGLIILFIVLKITLILSHFTNLKPLTNFNDKFEYIPILTSNIIADIIIVYITYKGILGSKTPSWNVLTEWYKKYRLSAMLADILIGVLYLLIARYLAHISNINFTLFTFTILAIIVQLFFDFGFYIFFTLMPLGENNMLDIFKRWAKYAKLDALWGDSILIVVGTVLSSLLNTQSFDFNINTLIVSLYLVPYFIYMKD